MLETCHPLSLESNALCSRLAFLADYISAVLAVKELRAPGVLAWAITKYGVLLDHCDLWLTPEEASLSVEFADLFVVLYLKLASKAINDKRPRYKIRPKYHSFFCEILSRTRSGSKLNPRYVGCNNEEDFVGKICGVLKGAVHPASLGRRVLERFLLGLNMRLMELRDPKWIAETQS